MGAFGTIAAIEAMSASAATGLESNSYTIGSPTGAVSNVAATPPTVAAGATLTQFGVSFTATSALSGTSASITISTNEALGSAPVAGSVSIIDDTNTNNCLEGAASGTQTASSVQAVLSGSCSIAAGDKVTVDFTATAPAAAGSLIFGVVTSANATSATANTITVTSTEPTVSVSGSGGQTPGQNATYTITGVPIKNVSGSTNSVTLSASSCSAGGGPCTGNYPGTGTVSWNGSLSGGGYSATYTPSGGTAATDPVTAASATNTSSVTLTLTNAVSNGGTLTITAPGQNPQGTGNMDYFTVQPSGGTAESTTNTVVFGSSVSSVTATPSPAVAGAPATYVVSFKSTTGVAAGSEIVLAETSDGTVFSNVTDVLVVDSAQSWSPAVIAPTFPASGKIAVTMPSGDSIAAGDTVTVTVPNVTNPSAQSVSDFAVTAGTDTIAQDATAYTITASGSAGIGVSVSPSTANATAAYTISNLYASSAGIAAGGSLSLTAPAGTVFPNVPGDYVITDVTTSSGTGTVASGGLSYTSPNAVSIAVPNKIVAGDQLTLTISDVVNPNTGTYNLFFAGNLAGPSAIAPFPHANVTYANGALVNFSGTVYVFAGGHPFGIATPAQLAKLKAIDKAAVLTAPAGATLPTAAPAAGTLISTNAVNGNPTIYVVGNDGALHGFATPAQFLGDGYDGALNVTTTSHGGLQVTSTAGALGSAAINSFATVADGTIVNSSGTHYVIQGKKAFGIPSLAALVIVEKVDKAKVLTGTVTSSLTGASISDGKLLTVNGTVYVSYSNNLYPFKSVSQLDTDGYQGTASVTAPNLGGLAVVSSYSGS
jgi:hypothetical protein